MNPFFDSLAQELQAHAQPAAPDSSHPPAQICPSAAPSSKTYRIDDIAAILDISRAAAYALVKSRIFVPSALVTPFAFFVHPLTHGLRRKGCDPPHCKTWRFVLLMLSVHGSRKQKTYKT